MKIKVFVACVGLLSTIALVSSCRKKKENEQATEIAKQNAIAESAFQDVQFMGDEAARGAASYKTFSANCAVLSYDTSGIRVKITIDYGTADCICKDGKTRRGKMFIEFDGPDYNSIGNVITYTPENYHVNGNKIEGSKTVTHTEEFGWTISSNATVTLSDGSGVIKWSSNRTRTQTSGSNTFMLQDDEYSVTGAITGTTARGDNFTISIVKPLDIQLGCRWIKGGSLEISSDGLDGEAKVDYGAGDCDNIASFTYNGKTKEITL